MDITFAINRIKELEQKKERLGSALNYFNQGYSLEEDKKYRVKLVAPNGVKSTNEGNEEEKNYHIQLQLTEAIVRQQLEQDLLSVNNELKRLSPVIEAANEMVRKALNPSQAANTAV